MIGAAGSINAFDGFLIWLLLWVVYYCLFSYCFVLLGCLLRVGFGLDAIVMCLVCFCFVLWCCVLLTFGFRFDLIWLLGFFCSYWILVWMLFVFEIRLFAVVGLVCFLGLIVRLFRVALRFVLCWDLWVWGSIVLFMSRLWCGWFDLVVCLIALFWCLMFVVLCLIGYCHIEFDCRF